MANVRQANTWYVDTTGSLSTKKNEKIAYIILSTNAGGDSITLRESASGGNKLTFKHSITNDSKVFDFSEVPLVFSQGIYVQALSASATATIVMKGG